MKTTQTIILAASLSLFCFGGTITAEAQIDTQKIWYTVFKDVSLGGTTGCTTARYAYVTASNMRANYVVSPPFGYTRSQVSTASKQTGSQGGWCPKSMGAAACQKRERDRIAYVWRGNSWGHKCLTVYWNGAVIYSK